ncbi:MAG: hypothetical protein ACLVEX_12650 [Ruthenibacterium lactatiformans]
MNNGFNKELFIRENGLNKYTKLLDFLECEVTRNTYREIVALLSSRRIRKFVYDGERYLMLRESINMPVHIFEKIRFGKRLKRTSSQIRHPGRRSPEPDCQISSFRRCKNKNACIQFTLLSKQFTIRILSCFIKRA